MIDYTVVRNVIFLGLTTITQWPLLATFLYSLLTWNMTELDTVYGSLQKTEDPVFTEHRFGIQCGDKLERTTHPEDVLPVIHQLEEVSRLAGNRISYDVETCSQWKLNAKEKYLGNLTVSTRHPALIIGNTFDPVTPLKSARNTSADLLGSVVLQHDGYGVSFLKRLPKTKYALTNIL